MGEKMKSTFLATLILISAAWFTKFPQTNPEQASQITVLLIVDNSGSMETSDPTGLRFTAVSLFASLLDPGDSLSLILFANESEVITNGIVTLDSQNVGGRLLENFKPPAADGYTNVKAALVNAGTLLDQANLSRGNNVVIVLLTDGKPEIQNPYPQYEKQTLALARSLDVPVMAIALTSAAQTPFLDQLAVLTKGSVVAARDASDLLDAYLQVLGQIKDRTVINGEKFTGSNSMMIEPALAPYINKLTFVSAKPEHIELTLLGPDGQEVTSDRSSDGHYSIFILENPAGGEYSLHLQGGGEARAWAIFQSRLRVQMISPGTIHPLYRDLPIIVNLLEETPNGGFIKIIGDANFTASVMSPDGKITSLDRFYDDGTHGDVVAGDGNYTRLFPSPNLGGTYLITIEVWKGVVPVQAETQVKVVKFPEFVVDSPAERIEIRDNLVELRVHLNTATSFDQGEVIARITNPSGEVEEVLMRGNGVYVAGYLPVEDGKYHVTFETRAVKYQGVEYQTSMERTFDVTIVRFINVAVQKIDVPVACFSSPSEILLVLSISSSGDEYLRFFVPTDWDVSPESIKIEKGRQDVQLRLKDVDGLSERDRRVEMLIEGRSRLEIQPEAMIGMDFQVPSLYARCRTPIRLGVAILFVVVVGVVSIEQARNATLPPKVSGTLRHWETGKDVTSAMEIDLTKTGKRALSIGSGATCDVMILYADLDPEQARVFAARSAHGVDVYLEPIGEVRKGYNVQNVKFILRHGETFRMGAHEFQYLSDHGE